VTVSPWWDPHADVFAVIEWPSDMAVEPQVFLGARGAVEIRVVQTIEKLVGDPDVWHDDAPGFLLDHPYPGIGAPPEAYHEWLVGLREMTTSPWVTLYSVSTDGGVLCSGGPVTEGAGDGRR
jgi:hypothetical protein